MFERHLDDFLYRDTGRLEGRIVVVRGLQDVGANAVHAQLGVVRRVIVQRVPDGKILRHGVAAADYGTRYAGIPYIPVVLKGHLTHPQKVCQNQYWDSA